MLNLRWRSKLGSDPNTFAFGLDGKVILVSATAQRTDTARPFDILIPCYLAGRQSVKPDYPYHLWPLHRLSESAFHVIGVQLTQGDRIEVYLIEIPEMVANDLVRAVS